MVDELGNQINNNIVNKNNSILYNIELLDVGGVILRSALSSETDFEYKNTRVRRPAFLELY